MKYKIFEYGWSPSNEWIIKEPTHIANEEFFHSQHQAYQAICNHSEDLGGKDLVILPFISIDLDGNVKQ